MNFFNLKVGARLNIVFGSMLLCIGLLTGIGIGFLSVLNDDTDAMMKKNLPSVQLSQNMFSRSLEIAGVLRDLLLNKDDTQVSKDLDLMFAKNQEMSDTLKKFAELPLSQPEKNLLRKVLDAKMHYEVVLELVLQRHKANQKDLAITIVLGNLREVQLTYLQSITALIAHHNEAMQLSYQHASASYQSATNYLLALGLFSLLMGAILSWRVSKSITRPLLAAARIAETVASGDLRPNIKVKRLDETGQVLHSLMALIHHLRQVMSQVRSGTDKLAATSTEIARDNLDLSCRTEQQASALQETAQAMDHLVHSIKCNNVHAQQANQLAVASAEVTQKAGIVVNQVLETMGEIHHSTHKIVDIIAVIDGIAFQANMLARRASVEAAAAGEHGQGFTMLASEVHSLAQRSTNAAQEIRTLISDSVEKVGAGSNLVNQAGANMQEVITSIERLSDIMRKISKDSQDQETGVEQINRAVNQLDHNALQNAALLDQATASAAHLHEQASKLAQVMNVFKLASDMPVHVDASVDEEAERRWATRHGYAKSVTQSEQALYIAVSAIGHAKRKAFQQRDQSY